MGTETVATKSVDLDGTLTKEYSLTIDGVIELEARAEAKAFFDELLDTLLEHIEKHGGMAGLRMSYEEYDKVESGEEEDETETT